MENAFFIRKSKDEALVTLRVEDEEVLRRAAATYRCQYQIQSLSLEDIFIEIVREY